MLVPSQLPLGKRISFGFKRINQFRVVRVIGSQRISAFPVPAVGSFDSDWMVVIYDLLVQFCIRFHLMYIDDSRFRLRG